MKNDYVGFNEYVSEDILRINADALEAKGKRSELRLTAESLTSKVSLSLRSMIKCAYRVLKLGLVCTTI